MARTGIAMPLLGSTEFRDPNRLATSLSPATALATPPDRSSGAVLSDSV